MITAKDRDGAIHAAKEWARTGHDEDAPLYVAADFYHLTKATAKERAALAALANAVERVEKLRRPALR